MKKLISFLTLLLVTFFANAQEGDISGKLLDASANNQPIVFGKVTVKETNQSVLTDYRGQYAFENLEAGIYTLEFTFLGYATELKKVEITNDTNIKLDASLKQSIAASFENIESITSSIE